MIHSVDQAPWINGSKPPCERDRNEAINEQDEIEPARPITFEIVRRAADHKCGADHILENGKH